MHSFRVVKQNMEYIHFLLNLTIVLLLIQAALKDSKTNYTSLLLQTLSMSVILRVETKFHFRHYLASRKQNKLK